MTTENYFETDLGFQLTANDATYILMALSVFIQDLNSKGYNFTEKIVREIRFKVENQLHKYEDL